MINGLIRKTWNFVYTYECLKMCLVVLVATTLVWFGL
jgi:hypothetical protein